LNSVDSRSDSVRTGRSHSTQHQSRPGQADPVAVCGHPKVDTLFSCAINAFEFHGSYLGLATINNAQACQKWLVNQFLDRSQRRGFKTASQKFKGSGSKRYLSLF